MENDLLEGYSDSEKQQLLFRLNGSVSKDDVKAKLSTYTGIPATSIDDNYAQKLYDLLKKNGSTGMAGVGITSAPALTQATTDQGGGGVLGGVMGYYGGPIGAAAAGPAVKGAHGFMEPATRKVVNFGDKWGGATGAMMMDPAAAVSSGKYSWGEIFQVPFTKKLFNW